MHTVQRALAQRAIPPRISAGNLAGCFANKFLRSYVHHVQLAVLSVSWGDHELQMTARLWREMKTNAAEIGIQAFLGKKLRLASKFEL